MTAQVTVGVDGSPESLAAVAWAAREAVLRDVPLHLLHVEAGARAEEPDGGSAALLAAAAERARGEAAALEVDVRCVRGRPEEVLGGAADDSELTVLGSRGLGALGGFLAGSVSLGVVATARHPVVLVRAPDDGGGPAPDGGIVAGVDLAHHSDRLLGFAFTEAARRGGGLHVLHCWSLPPVYVYAGVMDPHIGDELGQLAAEALEELLEPWRKTYSGVRVSHEAVTGSAGARLVDAAKGAALLAVGRRTRKVVFGPHVGPVAHAAVHHSPAPVAVVPLD
ncbi:universal stress protein [Streptomyces globosus]|uniref:Universal stress protein n=1 Tax=Streptomyces globosus TaxID=68209 RepID=A0A344U1J9_9ACTN|nr:universal stress protein [Streptomyces globosus]AXE24770.1 universal stress protein [Streptomyces globosus]